MMSHLREGELDEFLMGVASDRTAAHVAQCTACQEAVQKFRSSLEAFNDASMLWSDARSNGINRDLSEHKTPLRLTGAAVWSGASILVLALAGAIGVGMLPGRTVTGKVQPSSVGVEEAQEIASDNALLRSIDSAVNTPAPAPAELIGEPAATVRLVSRSPTKGSRAN